jgi:hypothetical protein
MLLCSVLHGAATKKNVLRGCCKLQRAKKTFCAAAANCSEQKKHFARLLQIAASKKNILCGCGKLQRPKKTFCAAAANCSEQKKHFMRLLQIHNS